MSDREATHFWIPSLFTPVYKRIVNVYIFLGYKQASSPVYIPKIASRLARMSCHWGNWVACFKVTSQQNALCERPLQYYKVLGFLFFEYLTSYRCNTQLDIFLHTYTLFQVLCLINTRQKNDSYSHQNHSCTGCSSDRLWLSKCYSNTDIYWHALLVIVSNTTLDAMTFCYDATLTVIEAIMVQNYTVNVVNYYDWLFD